MNFQLVVHLGDIFIISKVICFLQYLFFSFFSIVVRRYLFLSSSAAFFERCDFTCVRVSKISKCLIYFSHIFVSSIFFCMSHSGQIWVVWVRCVKIRKYYWLFASFMPFKPHFLGLFEWCESERFLFKKIPFSKISNFRTLYGMR